MKRIFNVKNLVRFVFITFISSIAYTCARMIAAPASAPVSVVTVRVKSDYALMLLQCTAGAFAMLLPGILRKRAQLNIPSFMLIIYALFLYCAVYLGEVRNFYYSVPHWDTVLHVFSGSALGALGFSIVSLLNKSENITFKLSPAFIALFAFCFALSLGVIWEIYEFTMDYLFGLNMQKYALETGELLIGRQALMDTMKDLIVDTAGALGVSTVGYISLVKDKGWLERFQLKQM